ncbi:MAG: radical SAM protein [bacterium]|nr:radical SAM protein [bacterium]
MEKNLPIIESSQLEKLPERARDPIEYRKSGLSLNHIQGCPLDCAYCIRHSYDLWDQRRPKALMSDAMAVNALVTHPYFTAHTTPLQLLNRDTDPFLQNVKQHTLAVLRDLDRRSLRNHVLVITRCKINSQDLIQLNMLRHIKLTILFTYSGIENAQIEPHPARAVIESLKTTSSIPDRNFRTILYWRPLVPGLNDSGEHIDRAGELAEYADATVYTGLFYRRQIAAYYEANGIPEPYSKTARRKIIPHELESRILDRYVSTTPLFRKTSCAVSYVHGLPDYNGHYGIRELCDICPVHQREICASAHRVPSPEVIHASARQLKEINGLTVKKITSRAAVVSGLDSEQPRYYLQHRLGFQIHDIRHPHHIHLHGRANPERKKANPDS